MLIVRTTLLIDQQNACFGLEKRATGWYVFVQAIPNLRKGLHGTDFIALSVLLRYHP